MIWLDRVLQTCPPQRFAAVAIHMQVISGLWLLTFQKEIKESARYLRLPVRY